MNNLLLGVLASLSSILASMGIGGGALFVVTSTLLLNIDHKYAQTLNLILFITSAIGATIFNFKNKKIKIDIAKKLFVPLIIGAICGTLVFINIDSNKLKMYFNLFLLIIGIYEIFSSLIKIKKEKNNNG